MLELFQGLTFRQLQMWERPFATGAVVGAVTLVIFFLGILDYTLITFLCRIMQIATVGCFVAVQLGKAPEISAAAISSEVSTFLTALEPQLTSVLRKLYEVVSWQDKVLSTKVLAGSILLAGIGNIFSDLTLLFLFTVAIFGWPLFYARFRIEVDAVLTTVKAKVWELMGKVPALSSLRDNLQKKCQ